MFRLSSLFRSVASPATTATAAAVDKSPEQAKQEIADAIQKAAQSTRDSFTAHNAQRTSILRNMKG